MISLLLHAPNLTEEVTFPATYENLQLALWKLGLVVHDPGVYTIATLAAKICCHTEVAEKIAELIQDEDTLEFVAEVINHFIMAPDKILEQMTSELFDDTMDSLEELNTLYYELICEHAQFGNCFYFPLSCEFQHPQKGIKQGTNHDLRDYAGQIYVAVQNMQDHLFHNLAQMAWQNCRDSNKETLGKILRANWDIIGNSGMITGRVRIESEEEFTEDEISFLCGWIQRMNREILSPRMMNWSILTENGLFFVHLWDEGEDYEVTWSLKDSGKISEENDCDDDHSICPECREKRNQENQMENVKWLEEMSGRLP